jgi:hypothetical protein
MGWFHVPRYSAGEILTFSSIVALVAVVIAYPFLPRSTLGLSSSEVESLAQRAERTGLAEDRIKAAVGYASMLHHVGSLREGAVLNGDPADYGLGDEDDWRRFLEDAERFVSKAGLGAEEQGAFEILRLEVLSRRGQTHKMLEGVRTRPPAEKGGFHAELIAARAHSQLGEDREALERLQSLQRTLGRRVEGAPEWKIRLGLAAGGPMRRHFGDLDLSRSRTTVRDRYAWRLRMEIDHVLKEGPKR